MGEWTPQQMAVFADAMQVVTDHNLKIPRKLTVLDYDDLGLAGTPENQRED